MITLSFYEEFLVSMALSFLMVLAPKIKNPVQLAALQGAITFLNALLAGQVSTT